MENLGAITAQVDSLSCTPGMESDRTVAENLNCLFDPSLNAFDTAIRCNEFVSRVLTPAFGRNVGVSLEPGFLTDTSWLNLTLSCMIGRNFSFDLPYVYSWLLQDKPVQTVKNLLKPQNIAFALHQCLTGPGLDHMLKETARYNSGINVFRICTEAFETCRFDEYCNLLKKNGFTGSVIAIEPNGKLHSPQQWITFVENARTRYKGIFDIGLAFDAAHLSEYHFYKEKTAPDQLLSAVEVDHQMVKSSGLPVHAVEINLIDITTGKPITHTPFSEDLSNGPIGEIYPRVVKQLTREGKDILVVVETNPGDYTQVVYGYRKESAVKYLKQFRTYTPTDIC